jgi:hypothetical protein
MSYSFSFRFKYPNVSPKVGCYHIHAPEHIATTHRLGAPKFTIDRVRPPLISATSGRRSIEFDCQTMNVPMHVFMHRRSAYESELTFTRALNAPSFRRAKNRAFLRLNFEVCPQVRGGHDLGVTFSFWNPVIFLMVPLFPIFVAINGIEDMFYLRELEDHGIPVDKGTWFDVYRRSKNKSIVD